MKFESINRRYTEVIAEWLAKGYTINSATMSGHQGEISKIDLTDGKEIIRVLLGNLSGASEKIGDRYYHMEGVELITGRVTDDVMPNSPNTWSNIWNNRLEVLSSEKFYEIGRTPCNGEKWYGTKDEAIAQQDKASARYNARYIPERKEFGAAAKSIALPYVRRQPRCKTVRPSEISVFKRHIKTRTGKQSVQFIIKAREQSFTLH